MLKPGVLFLSCPRRDSTPLVWKISCRGYVLGSQNFSGRVSSRLVSSAIASHGGPAALSHDVWDLWLWQVKLLTACTEHVQNGPDFLVVRDKQSCYASVNDRCLCGVLSLSQYCVCTIAGPCEISYSTRLSEICWRQRLLQCDVHVYLCVQQPCSPLFRFNVFNKFSKPLWNVWPCNLQPPGMLSLAL